MCYRRLKTLLSFCLCLSLFSLSSFCFADVTLTDEEAQEIAKVIEESKKDLTQVKKELKEQKEELQTVKDTYSEQKKSYEEQLSEAERKNDGLKTATAITGTSATIFLILMIVFIII